MLDYHYAVDDARFLSSERGSPKSANCQEHVGGDDVNAFTVDRDEGERWTRGCLNCTCGAGSVFCEVLRCEVPKCANPIIKLGDCCAYCPGELGGG